MLKLKIWKKRLGGPTSCANKRYQWVPLEVEYGSATWQIPQRLINQSAAHSFVLPLRMKWKPGEIPLT